MVFLWLFAKALEDTLGRGRLLVLFLFAGLVAAGAQELVESATPYPTLGAAGAVAGVIAAHTLLYPRARILCWMLIPFFVTFAEVPAPVLALAWLALQALDAVGQPPLAALLGGVLAGLVAAKLLVHGRALISAGPPQAVY